MASLPLTFVTISPKAKHAATVIFAHGLGDNGLDFSNNKEIRTLASQLPYIKWVFPSAAERAITAWKGDSRRQKLSRGWLDYLCDPLIYSVEYEEIPEYVEGIMESVRQLDTFIQSEIDSGIPEGRIVLGGFSQGGAISLITGLSGSQLRGASDTKDGWKLGGVVCLGGWLPIRETLHLSGHSSTIPVFWGHGVQDEAVTWKLSWESANFIGDKIGVRYGQYTKMGEPGVSFMSYGVAHWVAESEMEDLRQFLNKVLPLEE